MAWHGASGWSQDWWLTAHVQRAVTNDRNKSVNCGLLLVERNYRTSTLKIYSVIVTVNPEIVTVSDRNE